MNHALVQISQQIVLMNKAGEALVLRDHDGRLSLPGGRLEVGEAWREGLMREVFEETGISIYTIDRMLLPYQRISKSSGAAVYGVIFLGRTEQVEIKVSHEHNAFLWVKNLSQIVDEIFYLPEIKAALEIVFSGAGALDYLRL